MAAGPVAFRGCFSPSGVEYAAETDGAVAGRYVEDCVGLPFGFLLGFDAFDVEFAGCG